MELMDTQAGDCDKSILFTHNYVGVCVCVVHGFCFSYI